MSCQDTQSAEQQVNQKEAHFQRESSTLSDNKNKNNHHKFIKLSNSFIFIEINNSIWKTWKIKIADKLDINANHYFTEKIHIVYVIFRLKDDADQQIYAKFILMFSHSINHYQSYWNIWKKFMKIRIWFESVIANTLLWSSSTSSSALSI